MTKHSDTHNTDADKIPWGKIKLLENKEKPKEKRDHSIDAEEKRDHPIDAGCMFIRKRFNEHGDISGVKVIFVTEGKQHSFDIDGRKYGELFDKSLFNKDGIADIEKSEIHKRFAEKIQKKCLELKLMERKGTEDFHHEEDKEKEVAEKMEKIKTLPEGTKLAGEVIKGVKESKEWVKSIKESKEAIEGTKETVKNTADVAKGWKSFTRLEKALKIFALPVNLLTAVINAVEIHSVVKNKEEETNNRRVVKGINAGIGLGVALAVITIGALVVAGAPIAAVVAPALACVAAVATTVKEFYFWQKTKKDFNRAQADLDGSSKDQVIEEIANDQCNDLRKELDFKNSEQERLQIDIKSSEFSIKELKEKLDKLNRIKESSAREMSEIEIREYQKGIAKIDERGIRSQLEKLQKTLENKKQESDKIKQEQEKLQTEIIKIEELKNQLLKQYKDDIIPIGKMYKDPKGYEHAKKEFLNNLNDLKSGIKNQNSANYRKLSSLEAKVERRDHCFKARQENRMSRVLASSTLVGTALLVAGVFFPPLVVVGAATLLATAVVATVKPLRNFVNKLFFKSPSTTKLSSPQSNADAGLDDVQKHRSHSVAYSSKKDMRNIDLHADHVNDAQFTDQRRCFSTTASLYARASKANGRTYTELEGIINKAYADRIYVFSQGTGKEEILKVVHDNKAYVQAGNKCYFVDNKNGKFVPLPDGVDFKSITDNLKPNENKKELSNHDLNCIKKTIQDCIEKQKQISREENKNSNQEKKKGKKKDKKKSLQRKGQQ